jgi:putative ABC transport system substrate-binding protein
MPWLSISIALPEGDSTGDWRAAISRWQTWPSRQLAIVSGRTIQNYQGLAGPHAVTCKQADRPTRGAGRRGDPGLARSMGGIRRREAIALLGGAAAWPPAALAQQQPIPVIGFLHPTSPEPNTDRLRAFSQGLKEGGFIEGANVAIDYRWADSHNDRLPALAADLAQRKVAVIVSTVGAPTALAAKAATATIPIVFAVNQDPVALGLVASLARPGGNATGINYYTGELNEKRLELLRELVPTAARVGVLVNPDNAANTQTTLHGVEAAARIMGLQIQVFNATSVREIDSAFARLARERPDALFVGGDAFFNSRRIQFALLAARHALPASYANRDYPMAGGLMSYGSNVTDYFRQVGVYAARILKGAKPADLPVVQSSKLELVINAQAARVLGLTVPDKMLATADEVIE